MLLSSLLAKYSPHAGLVGATEVDIRSSKSGQAQKRWIFVPLDKPNIFATEYLCITPDCQLTPPSHDLWLFFIPIYIIIHWISAGLIFNTHTVYSHHSRGILKMTLACVVYALLTLARWQILFVTSCDDIFLYFKHFSTCPPASCHLPFCPPSCWLHILNSLSHSPPSGFTCSACGLWASGKCLLVQRAYIVDARIRTALLGTHQAGTCSRGHHSASYP